MCILLLEKQWQTVIAPEPEPIEFITLKESYSCYNQNNAQILALSYTSFYCCISNILQDFSNLRYFTAKLLLSLKILGDFNLYYGIQGNIIN